MGSCQGEVRGQNKGECAERFLELLNAELDGWDVQPKTRSKRELKRMMVEDPDTGGESGHRIKNFCGYVGRAIGQNGPLWPGLDESRIHGAAVLRAGFGVISGIGRFVLSHLDASTSVAKQ